MRIWTVIFMRIDIGGTPRIILNWRTGVYRFVNSSGMGKTLLFNCLMRMFPCDPGIVLYTYRDYLRSIPVFSGDPKLCRLLFFDRLDLYKDAPVVWRAIRDVKDHAMVLIDLKNPTISIADEVMENVGVSINRSVNSLEVV